MKAKYKVILSLACLCAGLSAWWFYHKKSPEPEYYGNANNGIKFPVISRDGVTKIYTRKEISTALEEDRVMGNGAKQVTKIMSEAFENGSVVEGTIGDLTKLPTVNQLNNLFNSTTALDRLAKADTEIHHIVPQKALEVFKELGALSADHSFGDVPGLALSVADHSKIHNALGMNTWLKTGEFAKLGTAEDKGLALVTWYDKNGYEAQANIAKAWLQLMNIIK